MAGGNSHEIWTGCIEAKYLASARTYSISAKCPTCKSPKDCNNYYCLQCKIGGLCPITFRTPGPTEHERHPWLQIYRYTRHPSVREVDLKRLIGEESTKYIQKYSLNKGRLHCFLESKNKEPASTESPSPRKRAKNTKSASGIKKCRGCRAGIVKSQDSKEDFLVCSLQCMIIVAKRQPEEKLLEMVDGSMDLTDPPLLATEKARQKKQTDEDSAETTLDVAADLVLSLNSNGEVQSTASASGSPDYSSFPPGYQCEELDSLIAAIKANGDWEKYLGARGRDQLEADQTG